MGTEASDPIRRREQLLPESGIGVVPPWLVIAPAGRPVIRLDLRLIDRVEVRPEGEEYDEQDELDPVPDDSEDDRRCDVLLTCGELEVILHIADGPEAAERIVAESAPLTRERTMATEPPTSSASDSERVSRPASYGKLVIISSTPDAEILSTDAFAGYTYELTEPQMMVGRTNDNDIIINHPSISREHARVTRDSDTGRYTITDLHASNGLRVNGDRCIAVELSSGDIVDLGHVRMRFIAPGEEDFWSAPTRPADAEQFLIIGSDVVLRRGEHIHVGHRAFRIAEVEEYALQGAELPLGGGRLLQAAMALLVVAVAERTDTPGLSNRG